MKNNKGFSLVELAIGLAVITVLVLAISMSSGLRNNARIQSATQSIQTLRSAAESYLTIGHLNYAGLSIDNLKKGNLLPSNFDATKANPWGGSYTVGANGSNNTQFNIVLSTVNKDDSAKLLAYFSNSATNASYEEEKGSFVVTF